MPRQPVKPEDRQRVARACDACKASKKRCDGNQPCSACGRKGQVHSCRYTAPGRRQRTWSSQSTRLISPQSSWDHNNNNSNNSNTSDVSKADPLGRDESEESFENGTETQPPVMLSSMSGEKGEFGLVCRW
jgi:uncharacterized Zn finger protein (UPF0148 family)